MVKLEQKLQDMGGILRDFLSQVQGNNHLNFPISFRFFWVVSCFGLCILIVFPPSFVAEIIFILMRICFGVGGGIELPSFVTCNKTHSLDLNS